MADFRTTYTFGFGTHGSNIDWKVPVGVERLEKVECWGAGGWSVHNAGGGGAYSKKLNVPVVPGDYLTLFLGAGDYNRQTKTAFSYNGKDYNGGCSAAYFKTSAGTSGTGIIGMAVVGGAGSGLSTSNTTVINNGYRGGVIGLGGSASECVGDICYSGGNGGRADLRTGNPTSQIMGGAGGGAGGPGGNGTAGGDGMYPTNKAAPGQSINTPDFAQPMGWGGGYDNVFQPQLYGGGGRGLNGSDNTRQWGADGAIRITVVNYNFQQLFLGL